MPELPSFKTRQDSDLQFSLAELSSAYAVLRNYVLVNESTKYKPGSHDAFRYLRVKSIVRKFEAVLDAQADHQLRTDAQSTEN